MKYARIDLTTGLFIEDIITDAPTDDLVAAPCTIQCYWPKWNGTQWVEGATQEYIDNLLASATPAEPTTDEVLDNLITTLVDKGVLY